MSDLREKLVARFTHIFTGCAGDYDKPMEALADECIRQMEWARTGWVASKDNNGSRYYTVAGPRDPLTAAPDAWRPE